MTSTLAEPGASPAAEPGPAAATTARRSLPHRPSLDGLRGLAVLAVVVYHLDRTALPGGFLGVSLFFTLSGFLIANLLLAEWRGTGGVHLGAFWGRRFRRLLPAALLGLALAVLLSWWWADARQLASLRGDVLAALAYVANWRFIVEGNLYGAGFESPSPVLHYWSLAIEEQFYLVVGLVGLLLARHARRRRTWMVVFGAMALGSVLATLRLWNTADVDRIYFGSDTRAFELLAGVLLAVVVQFAVPPRLARHASRHVLWVAAGVAVLVAFALVDTGQRWLYRGGFWLFALGSVLLILAALDDGPVRRALSWRPLVALGVVSYGVYLFHWPIFVFLDHDRTGLSGPALVALRVGATLAVATASYRLLERPVRDRRWRVRPVPALAVVVGVAVLLAVGTTALDRAATTRDVVATPDLALADQLPAAAADEPAVGQPPVERVLFLGDSLVHQSWATLAARLRAAGIEPRAIGGEGEHLLWEGAPWPERLDAALREFDPQVVVLEACCGWGTPWREEAVTAADGTPLEPDTDASWREWARVAAELTDRVRADGRVAVWVLAPPARTNGYYGPVEGRIGRANEIYRRLAACRPGVGLVDWSALSGPGGAFAWELPDRSGNPVRVRHADGLHFTPEGQAVVADWTLQAVRAQWAAQGDAPDGTPVTAVACDPS